jgi:predicted acylesterase/phospholipase RssA
MNYKKLLINVSVVVFLLLNDLGLLANDTLNVYQKNTNQNERPTVAVVLSGGGARGIAHIGMLKYLEDNNIKIDYIVGTSIGAIIGGLYCAGYSTDQIDSIFTNVDLQSIFKIQQPNNRENTFFNQKKIEDRSILTLRFNNFKFIRPEAFSEGDVVNDFFQTHITNSEFFYVNDFDSLKYPFRAIATDLASGQSVALKSGNLARAMRASSTFPITYAPVRIDDMILIDGGVMANVPVRFAKDFNPDIIIAMDATTPIHKPEVLNSPLKMLDQTISISMENFAKLDAQLADILIVPQIDKQYYLDFSNVKDLIDIGYSATQEVLKNRLPEFISGSHNEILKQVQNDSETVRYDSETVLYDSEDYLNQDFDKIKRLAGLEKNNLDNLENLMKITVQTKNNKAIIVNKIEIIHNKINSPNMIFADFPVKIGDTLTSEKLALCYHYLERRNKFDDIDIQIISDENDKIDGNDNILRIELKEISNQTLRFTGRLDNERNVQLGIDFITKNIFSTNLINQISLLGSGNSRYADITFFNPLIFNRKISTHFTTYYHWKDINVYDWTTTSNRIAAEIIDTNFVRRRGAKVAVGGNIENKGLLNVEYRIENQTYGYVKTHEGTVNRENIINQDFVSLLGFSCYYDSENARFFATSGEIINVLLETNLFATNLYSQFSKLQLFLKTNINFGKHNIAPSLFFGAGDRTLPYPEFFSLGGQDNFFGMREYEEMGRQVFRTSVDYRLELPSFLSLFNMKSYASARYDLGSIWEMPEEIKFSTLKHGVGASISIDTPIGPAVFSVGRSFSFVRMNEKTSHIRWSDVLLYFRLGMRL